MALGETGGSVLTWSCVGPSPLCLPKSVTAVRRPPRLRERCKHIAQCICETPGPEQAPASLQVGLVPGVKGSVSISSLWLSPVWHTPIMNKRLFYKRLQEAGIRRPAFYEAWNPLVSSWNRINSKRHITYCTITSF